MGTLKPAGGLKTMSAQRPQRYRMQVILGFFIYFFKYNVQTADKAYILPA